VFSYSFAAPAGNYAVTLKFAEGFTGAGQRDFNVAINNVPVLSNFDIYAAAGGTNIAVDKTFTVASNGSIAINFTQGIADYAKIDAIQIVAASSTFTPIRVSAGGAGYTDSLGQVWSADTGANAGNTWNCGCSITGTSDPTLYQGQRWGVFSYNFSTPPGNYAVTLKFAEGFTAAGQRLFNVGINGVPVLSNFDIFATSGGTNVALDETFNVASAGNIEIDFTQGSADFPKVDGIQVVSLDAPAAAAGSSPQSVGSSTTGISATGHFATVTWTASDSASITGYNVYSANTSGGPYNRITSAPDTSTLYTDSSVQAGGTYYYVITTVDSNGVESSYSNEASVNVP
jgi:hypothetical protein